MVVDHILVVASSMVAQRIAGEVLDNEFANFGKAFEAIRKVPESLANDVRNLNRAANYAKHDLARAIGANIVPLTLQAALPTDVKAFQILGLMLSALGRMARPAASTHSQWRTITCASSKVSRLGSSFVMVVGGMAPLRE